MRFFISFRSLTGQLNAIRSFLQTGKITLYREEHGNKDFL